PAGTRPGRPAGSSRVAGTSGSGTTPSSSPTRRSSPAALLPIWPNARAPRSSRHSAGTERLPFSAALPRFFQARPGFGEMLLDGLDLLRTGGVEGELDAAFADGRVGEGAIVLDVHDVGAALGDERRQARERARLVAEDHAEAHEAPVLHEAAHDDPGD